MRALTYLAPIAFLTAVASLTPTAKAASSWQGDGWAAERVGLSSVGPTTAASDAAPPTEDLLNVLLRSRAARPAPRVAAGLKGHFSQVASASAMDDALLRSASHAAPLPKSIDGGEIFRTDRPDATPEAFAMVLLPSDWRSAGQAGSVGRPGSSLNEASVETLAQEFSIDTQPAVVPLPGAALAGLPLMMLAYAARRQLVR